MFSSYILEGWIMLHLLMCSSFIGRVANTGLNLMLLLYASWYYRTTGPGWLVFSSIARRLAQGGLCSVVLHDGCTRLTCVQ